MAERAAIPSFQVLYEDNHLLVANKPADLATMGVAEGAPSLITEAKRYLKKKYDKPGNVYVGVVSRLDTVATGVIVLARTSKAAARLSELFREATAGKIYWAAVAKKPASPHGKLVQWVRKDDKQMRMVIAQPQDPGAQRAKLSYQLIETTSKASLLEVELETGRKHQIRLQLSNLGSPIIGDRKYGSKQEFPQGIALHARSLTILHPTTRAEMTFEAPPPPSWDRFEFDLPEVG